MNKVDSIYIHLYHETLEQKMKCQLQQKGPMASQIYKPAKINT